MKTKGHIKIDLTAKNHARKLSKPISKAQRSSARRQKLTLKMVKTKTPSAETESKNVETSRTLNQQCEKPD